jgi:hypothetical protein
MKRRNNETMKTQTKVLNALGLASYSSLVDAWRADGTKLATAKANRRTFPSRDDGPYPTDVDPEIDEAKAEIEYLRSTDAVRAGDPDMSALRDLTRKYITPERARLVAEASREPVNVEAPPPPPEPAALAGYKPSDVERRAKGIYEHTAKLERYEASQVASPPPPEHSPFASQMRALGEAERLIKAERRATEGGEVPCGDLFGGYLESDESASRTGSGSWARGAAYVGSALEALAALSDHGALTIRHLDDALKLLAPEVTDLRPYQSKLRDLEAYRARAVKREEAREERRRDWDRAHGRVSVFAGVAVKRREQEPSLKSDWDNDVIELEQAEPEAAPTPELEQAEPEAAPTPEPEQAKPEPKRRRSIADRVKDFTQ